MSAARHSAGPAADGRTGSARGAGAVGESGVGGFGGGGFGPVAPRHGALDEPGPVVSAPAFGRLVGAEWHRLWARRLMRVLLILLVLGYALTVVLLWVQHSKITPADRAQATVQRDAQVAQLTRDFQACIQGKTADEAEVQCGTSPANAADFPIDYYLKNHPLRPRAVTDTAVALGVGVAALGFVIAATFIGAEWSSKNLVAWLFWEPRRLRLIGAKLLALISVLLAVSALVQVSWAVLGRILLHHRGMPLGPEDAHLWSRLVGVQERAALVVVATVLLGFAVAQLLRSTTAAFAVGFVYFAVAETAVRALLSRFDPFLLSSGIAAWVQHGGANFFRGSFNTRTGEYFTKTIHVSNGRGALTIAVYVLVPLAVAVLTLRRRDIS